MFDGIFEAVCPDPIRFLLQFLLGPKRQSVNNCRSDVQLIRHRLRCESFNFSQPQNPLPIVRQSRECSCDKDMIIALALALADADADCILVRGQRLHISETFIDRLAHHVPETAGCVGGSIQQGPEDSEESVVDDFLGIGLHPGAQGSGHGIIDVSTIDLRIGTGGPGVDEREEFPFREVGELFPWLMSLRVHPVLSQSV